jgi:hypothetical protein
MSVTKRIPIAIGIKPNAVTTFTNKTIDGSQNTLQNIPTSALQFNSISINGSTIPLGGSLNIQVEGGDPIIDTNTTYSVKASSITSGASLDLDAGGSGVGTDSVNFVGAGNVTVTRLDASTIRISDAGQLGGVTLTSESVATLTNKTISGSSNTFSNIPTSALTANFITINGSPVTLGGSVTIAGGGGGSGDLTASGIATLTNKTISGSNNTLTNISNSSLVNSFISINGTAVALGTNFTVSGLGDVTLTGAQDLSNKSLASPIIATPQIIGNIKVGSAGGGNAGTTGQILKSNGSGSNAEWINQSAVAAGSIASALTIGSGLTGAGGTEFNGSNGVTISINTGIVATLTGAQTLSSKTLNNTTLSGSLTIGASTGSAGQVLISTGTGVEWGAGGGGGGEGSFNGPVSSTDNAIVRYDGTTGDTAQNSLVTISDTGVISAPSVASVIPFYHVGQLAFPAASGANGAVAISASDNAAFYASNGNWIQLAKSTDVTVSTRQTFSTTTGSLTNNTTVTQNITGAYKSYLLFKIQTDRAAWVRVYTTSAARTADASRSIDVDPLPGSGVIAEVITTGSSTQVLTPATIGFNDDSTPAATIYLSVTNRSGTTGSVTVTLTALKLEA